MLFYARDQNAKELNEIRKLDLSAKGILHLSDLSVFDQMTSLTSLNISDHPEFLISDEEMEKIQKEQKEGAIDSDNIEFLPKLHQIDEFLSKLKHVRRLTCDYDLEEYIFSQRETKGFLPSLKEINRVSIKVKDMNERQREKDIR